MKKFLAVLLAVALLGVAGAAFAGDDAAHGGHKYDSGFSTEYSAEDVASADIKGITLISGDQVGDASSQTSSTKTVKALRKLTKLTTGKTYGFNIEGLSLVDPILSTTKLYDGEITASVVVAGVASEGTFYDENWNKIDTVTSLSAIKHASFKATAATADLSIAADKDPGGPTSNKGSGGCNAGFASLAVLALSALALRRKAR